MLNKRLFACAEFVIGDGIAVDVGTDHAYLPVYLVKSGIVKKAYACDIADGPLLSAQKSVEREGLSDSIKIIKSDGLENVSSSGVSDVIIAGMGGELIEDIISRAEWVKNGVNLVLQPNTKVSELMSYLYKNGYKIKSEKAVTDKRFTYIVINAEYIGKPGNAGIIKCIVGELDMSDATAREYIIGQINKLYSAAKGMLKSGDERLESEAKEIIKVADSLSERIKSGHSD